MSHPDQPTPTPGPSQPPSPSTAAGGSSLNSASASSGADFIDDPGPAFDPKSAPAPPDPDELDRDPLAEGEMWDEERVKELLVLQGETTHWILKVDDADEDTWVHTERDLKTIAPPLTRILNRYDHTRAAAAAGDEILLATAVTRYGLRNYTKRRRYLRQRAEQGPQPVTGVPAPEGTGPEHDADYQRVQDPGYEPVRLVEPDFDAPPAITPKGAHQR